MSSFDPTSPRLRIVFLLLLAICISLLFYQVIEDFLLALVLAAALAGLAYPIYGRLVDLLRGHRMAASAATVVLSLVLVIAPLILFIGVLVNQALEVSEETSQWVSQQIQQPDQLQHKIEAMPSLQRWLPYQDKILEKTGELAGKVGGFVAHGLAAGAKGTAVFFMMLFVMLYAMFYFLIDGRQLLSDVLRFTPLSADDKDRMVRTFVSVTRATLKGTLVIGVVQGVLAGLSFAVAGINGAIFWGTIMAVLSIIPGVGTALVWIPAVIYLALQGEVTAAVGSCLVRRSRWYRGQCLTSSADRQGYTDAGSTGAADHSGRFVVVWCRRHRHRAHHWRLLYHCLATLGDSGGRGV